MGHHRIPDRLLLHQLIGRVTDIKNSGLFTQVSLSIGKQHITSIITADAVRELRLKKDQVAAAPIKSIEVIIILPKKTNRLTLAVQFD